MATILSTRFARRSDDEFTIAAARAIFCTSWAADLEAAGRASELSGREITDIAGDTPRWAFRAARDLVRDIETAFGMPLRALIDGWLAVWDGDRDPTDAIAGWYSAMQAMGHGIGLLDAAGIEISLPHIDPGP